MPQLENRRRESVTGMPKCRGGLAAVFSKVLFSSHLLCLQDFLFSPSQPGHKPRVQTKRLTHVVENARVSRILAVWTDCAPLRTGEAENAELS
jgi:hypothetical protein